MEKIRITLETLYDILRNEKKKEDLQKLEESFFQDVVNYLKEKHTMLESKKPEQDLFASGERQKLEYELRSIKRILKEIYEKRERKMIDIALNKSKTDSDLIDTSAMLKAEKQFYQQLLGILDDYRKGILLNLFRGELPSVEKPIFTEKKSWEGERKAEPNQFNQLQPNLYKESSPGMSKIKFIRATPSFVWKDLKVYGPFEQGDETEIFTEVADLLVRKSRAEKV